MAGVRIDTASTRTGRRIAALLLAVAAPALGQISITSVQSSELQSPPRNIQGITTGTQLDAEGFVVYLNGTFNYYFEGMTVVEWDDPDGLQVTTLEILSQSPTQIQAFVPQSLYTLVTANTRTATITVVQDSDHATAQFFVHPPLAMASSPLPFGTVNVPYSTPIVNYGTPPYIIGSVTGSVPGLTAGTGVRNQFLAGTPTTPGVYNVTPVVTDQWGNTVTSTLVAQIVGPGSITSLSPNSMPAGSGLITLTVNGVNFVNPTSPIGGSRVQWTANTVTTVLTTTFVSTTQLRAIVPTALMSAAGAAAVKVSQPDDTFTNALPFTLVAPALTSLNPSTVTANGPGFTLTLNGSNFATRVGAADVSAPPYLPQVQVGNQTLTAVLVNSGVLTVAVPSNAISTAGQLTVRVTNPGGAATGTLPLTVTPSLAIGTSSLAAGTVGTPYSVTVTATGGTPPYQWSATGLPSPLTINPTSGQITGTPTANGTFSVVLKVTDAAQVQKTVTLPLVINPATLVITTSSLPAGTTGTPYSLTATATGGITPYQWAATGLPSPLTINPSSGQITGTPAANGTFSVLLRVTDAAQVQKTVTLPLVIQPAALVITAASLPPGTAGSGYSFRMTATGGVSPYQWAASGLPAGLTIQRLTGDITGTPQSAGTFPVSIQVTDSLQTSTSRGYSVTIAVPAPVISTPTNLPDGTVGIPYAANLDVSRGGPFSFSLSSGHLPDGLTISSSGGISGVPTRAAIFDFLVVASDERGNSPSKGFTILIKPAPLSITEASRTLTVGSAASIVLTATGGTVPYKFGLSCSLPAGLSFDGKNTISGTPTTAGVSTCHTTVTDNTGATAARDLTITVVPPDITFLGGDLPGGVVGESYTATVTARGGTPPFTYTGSGLPGGLTISTAGTISGTPTTADSFSFSVTATDSKRTSRTATFNINVKPPGLSITTTTLPTGTVGTPYSATLVAAGGAPGYTWSVGGLPSGVRATAAGILSGTPDTPGSFPVDITVTDSSKATATTRISIRIDAAALVITTASAPDGVVGMPYSASFTATGGVPPFTWTVTGLPPGLSISSAGAISGQPTASGVFNATVTVRDSAGTTSSRAYSITITLPPAPPLSYSGVSGTSPPLMQPVLTVSLGAPYPVDVTVTLTLTFRPDSGADDPAIQFSTGGRTATVTIPAGSTTGATSVGVQTGTVAGVITITSKLQAGATDITPSPAPLQTIRIDAGAPVITQVTGARTPTGFTVTIVGYVTDREVTQAVFQFNPTPGTNLQTTSLTVSLDALFAGYFGSTAAAPFGGQFTFTQPFTVNGNVQGISSITVTLTNRVGTSAPGSVTLN